QERGGKRGGIIADEMGLGKTVLGIARIVDRPPMPVDCAHRWAQATLIVCPISLISQWENEVKNFADGVSVVKHHGPSRSSDPLMLQDIHVVITSYATMASEYATICMNSGSRKSALFRMKWWRIILDEAHLIRNWMAKRAEVCFNVVGKYRWCFTGTPIQNRVEDLYSMFKFLNIEPLGDLQEFRNYILKPFNGGQVTLAIECLQVVLSAIMLRRRKDVVQNDALQLPDHHVHVVQCQFDEGEQGLYHTLEGCVRSKVEDWVKQGSVKTGFACVLEMLLRLHQACDHPMLVRCSAVVDEDLSASLSSSDSLGRLSQYIEDLNAKLDNLLTRLHLEANDDDDEIKVYQCTKPAKSSSHKSGICNVPSPSAKMRQLAELLLKIDADLAGRGKTIIFSHFMTMLDLVQQFLTTLTCSSDDGSMSPSEHEQNLQYIENDTDVKCILVSIKAGDAPGLNFTACNNVILLEPWWNPAVKEQAFDRVHRIGQLLPVNIYKLVVQDSVEEHMLELQNKKQKIADTALGSNMMSDVALDIEDVRCLFQVVV
ncbi:SNF2 family N-terminal domain-containing protein, partial [Pisolithus croceorrhizus]